MLDIYENKSAGDQLSREAIESWVVDKIEYVGGIKIYLKGCDYPQKGLPTPEALFVTNQVKKILLTSARTFHIFLLFFSKQKLVNAFNTVCWNIISPYTLKPQYRTDFTIEIGNFIYRFMEEYGLEEKSAETFANILAHIFEYDNAYRLRMQDLFTASSFELLNKSPRKELRRLLELNRIRDFKEANTKFKLFATLISLVMLSPKAKYAFRQALIMSDLSKLQFDEGDRYWALQRIDYNAFGKTQEERKDMLKGFNIVKGVPINA